MAVSTAPSSLSFFTSSLFLSSSIQNSKLFTNWKTNSLKPQKKPSSLTSQLATLPILSFTGEKVGETSLELKSAPPETARAVVHRAIITDLQNKRRGTASTLTRAEVRGGGKKPYPQKKTGGARRGSQRTPLRPGGGVQVFGPKPRDWFSAFNRVNRSQRLLHQTASNGRGPIRNTH